MKKIVECIPNFSEGRNKKVINLIFNAAKKVKGVKVFELESDPSHNRMLFTVVGSPFLVYKSVLFSVKVAVKHINMEKHKGEHPRIGAVDVVPFVPVSGVTMKECILLAKKLGKNVAKEFQIPVYLYEEAAARKDRVNLADLRKGEYEGLKDEIKKNADKRPDYGPNKLHPTAGAMVIGARKYLIAYNVNLKTKDVSIAKKIADKIREKNGGLKGVKALGFKVGGYAQVSMNLVDFQQTNFNRTFTAVEEEAKKYKVEVKSSEIYGMLPLEALVKAVRDSYKIDTFKADQILEKRLYE